MILLTGSTTMVKMNRKLLYNPFIIIAGLKSLIIGFAGLLLTSFLAFKTGTHFNGLLNIDFAKDSELWVYSLENISHWIISSIIFYSAGSLLSNSRIRIIDILGTVLFSRLPLFITPLIRIIPFFQSFMVHSLAMYVLIGIYIISVIWTIILLVSAFKVSCNLKGEKLIISFIVSMILAEGLTKLLLFILI